MDYNYCFISTLLWVVRFSMLRRLQHIWKTVYTDDETEMGIYIAKCRKLKTNQDVTKKQDIKYRSCYFLLNQNLESVQ